jgi:hypothetical protein
LELPTRDLPYPNVEKTLVRGGLWSAVAFGVP